MSLWSRSAGGLSQAAFNFPFDIYRLFMDGLNTKWSAPFCCLSTEGDPVQRKILANAGECRGCRMCELVCSFHQTRTFSPQIASIKIYRDNQNGRVEVSIDETCDRCQGEPRPLCVKYCVYEVLTENPSQVG